MLALARAYSDAVRMESGALNRFCSGCAQADGRDACPIRVKMQAYEHDECDWSMIAGVGAMPRTLQTLTIWDPGQGDYIAVPRTDETAVREAISRNLRTKL